MEAYEVKIRKEDLSQIDSGGGYRESKTDITIDSSLSPRLQRQAVLYETLSALLSPLYSHKAIQNITEVLGDVLDQLEG